MDVEKVRRGAALIAEGLELDAAGEAKPSRRTLEEAVLAFSRWLEAKANGSTKPTKQ